MSEHFPLTFLNPLPVRPVAELTVALEILRSRGLQYGKWNEGEDFREWVSYRGLDMEHVCDAIARTIQVLGVEHQ